MFPTEEPQHTRNGMTGFVTHNPLLTSRHSTSVSETQPIRRLQGAFRAPRRYNLRMCMPEDDTDVQEPMQGPSQAPTKAGISTAGLSEWETEFIEACYRPDIEKIDRMLDDGMHHGVADINGRTAMHFCAGNGLHTICRKLLDAGADINKQDVMGLTPLHMATGYKKVETVRFLVEAQADANIACYRGQLPVELAESMLEKTPQKRFFVVNGEYVRLRELVEVLDEATEVEEEEEEEEEETELDEEDVEVGDEGMEITEATESAKFVVRVKPKGSAPPSPPPTVKVDDVKVTIRVKEPKTQK